MKMLARISTALILIGLLIPGVALARESDPLGALASLAYSNGPSIQMATVTEDETTATLIHVENIAPGDRAPEGTYHRYLYKGNTKAKLYLNTWKTGDLTTCSGGGMFTVAVEDRAGKTYQDNVLGQDLGEFGRNDVLELFTTWQMDIAAGNDCQGQSASFGMEVLADAEAVLTVEVLDASPRNGTLPLPIANATVTLTGGLAATTQSNGEAVFHALAEGTYDVTVTALDPTNSVPGTRQTWVGQAVVTKGVNQRLTARLSWVPFIPQAQYGSISVAVRDASDSNGAQVPIAGASVKVTGVATERPATTNAQGNASFGNLLPGQYTVTVTASDPKNPDPATVQTWTTNATVLAFSNTPVTALFKWAEPVQAGTLTVRALDDSERNGGAQLPISGATVTVKVDGADVTRRTDATGQVEYTNLTPGEYVVTVTAMDPANTADSTPQTFTGKATVPAGGRATVNALFRWAPPRAEPVKPKGTIIVKVVDGSDRHKGEQPPISGADVKLDNGQTLQTGADGTVRFKDLSLGGHQVGVSAIDPANPSTGDVRVGNAAVTLSEEKADGTLTLILTWNLPAAAPTGPGVTTPPAVDNRPGTISGRICSPAQPGADIVAEGPDGRTAKTTVVSDGILGVWKPYTLAEVLPGVWKLTLKMPGGKEASQTLTVLPGAAVQAADFTLACTGSNAAGQSDRPSPWPYVVGVALLTFGIALKRPVRQ